MTKVLVVYGSRHGATRGIAERIGQVLRTEGIVAEVATADRVGEVRDVDAFVVGSCVYMGKWLDEPIEFIRHNVATLAARPLWLFSSGPLSGSTAEHDGADPLADALGPAEGPGSGGRRKIAELAAKTHPREHRVFLGAYDPNDPPQTLSERLVRMMPASKGILPAGDFRDWEDVEAWAREIAASVVAEMVPA